jgi:hypothetical protein
MASSDFGVEVVGVGFIRPGLFSNFVTGSMRREKFGYKYKKNIV